MSEYYTPIISEINTDFEYEHLVGDKWEKRKDFSNAYDYEDSPIYAVWKEIKDNKIRVKFLDQQDLEDLLGSLPTNHDTIKLEFRLNEKYQHWLFLYDTDDQRMFIENFHQSKMVGGVLPEETRTQNTVFSGTIKNKSELRTLLSQLNIK